MEPRSVPSNLGGLFLGLILASLCVGCIGRSAEVKPANAPFITSQPASQTVDAGQTASFAVSATGTAPLTYQWQKNGSSIPGANAAAYTTAPTTAADSGTAFNVVVSNSAGSVISNPAALTVQAPPSITTQPANQTVTAGQTATFSVAATGATPLAYQWQKNGTNISGANAASYTTPATTNADNGSTFDVVVSNSAGTVTSNAATLTVNAAPVAPTISTQPANQTVAPGQAATFSVTATGTAPLTYQWQKNGTDISGANAASYTTPPETSADNGCEFDVVVSNSAGSTTSNQTLLTVSSTSQINFGSGFTSSGLTLNGSATISGSRLRLTDGGAGEAGSAFFDGSMNVQSFITDFTFQLTNATGEGFTFTIQGNSPSALGADDESLGYGANDSGTSGIGSSIAVGFQLYSTVLGGIQVSRTGMWTDGASPGATPGSDTTPSGLDLHSGDVMDVHVAYDGTTLRWTITDTATNATLEMDSEVDIQNLVGGNTAYVGFTGGTGPQTATQDILTWIYTPVPVSAFAWPVDMPVTYAPSSCGGNNDYSTYCAASPINGQYHTGIDVCPQSPGCAVGNPVYATSSGVVALALVVSDPTQTMCDGSSTAGYQINPNTSNLGNVIVIAHPNGKFSLYGHLDCVWPGVVAGMQVSGGTRIGNMGHSAFGTRDHTFTPHTHFEVKDGPVTGDPTNRGYSGYTTDLPDGYGYHDARIYINPFAATSISPTAVKVGSVTQSVYTGPSTTFAFLTSIASGQEFVAFASSGSWYQIYLPNDSGPTAGWIPASSVTMDSGATLLQVVGAGSSGVTIQAGANATENLISWDETFGNCAATAKIWNGQWYVSIGSQNGFNEFYLPLNYYFSSSAACAEPSSAGPTTGWASATFLQ